MMLLSCVPVPVPPVLPWLSSPPHAVPMNARVPPMATVVTNHRFNMTGHHTPI